MYRACWNQQAEIARRLDVGYTPVLTILNAK